MSGTLQDCISNIQDNAGALTGINYAPDYVPDSIPDFPALIAYPGGGRWEFGPAGLKTGKHDINVELHVSRSDTANAIKTIMTYYESIPNSLMKNMTFGGNAQTFDRITCTGIISMTYSGIDTLGVRWTVEGVKLQSAIA